MLNFTIEVIEGDIKVVSLNLIHNTPDVKVIEVDTLGGYYDLQCSSLSDPQAGEAESVMLTPHNSQNSTEILLMLSELESWELMAGGQHKNSFNIVMTNRNTQDRNIIWEN